MATLEQEAQAFKFKKRKPPLVVVREGDIVNACIRWLMARSVFIYRNNSGAYKTETGHWIRYGYPGSPDIIGIMPATSARPGVFLGIEAKTAVGRLNDNQLAFEQKAIENGAIYMVVRGVDDLEEHLLPLLRGP